MHSRMPSSFSIVLDRIGSEFWKQAELIGNDDTGLQ